MPNGVWMEMTLMMPGMVCWTMPGIFFMPRHPPLPPASSCMCASSSGTSTTRLSNSWQKCWRLLRSSWWTLAFGRRSPVHPAMARTCCNHCRGCRSSMRMATVSVVAPAAAEGAPVPVAAATVKGTEEPTFNKTAAWLMECGLLIPEEGLSEE